MKTSEPETIIMCVQSHRSSVIIDRPIQRPMHPVTGSFRTKIHCGLHLYRLEMLARLRAGQRDGRRRQADHVGIFGGG